MSGAGSSARKDLVTIDVDGLMAKGFPEDFRETFVDMRDMMETTQELNSYKNSGVEFEDMPIAVRSKAKKVHVKEEYRRLFEKYTSKEDKEKLRKVE